MNVSFPDPFYFGRVALYWIGWWPCSPEVEDAHAEAEDAGGAPVFAEIGRPT